MEKTWSENMTPEFDVSADIQQALNWWHGLAIQNLENMNDSWVGYLWKYYPEKSHPYHLTANEVYHIYKHENKKTETIC